MKPEELQLGDIVATTPSGMPIKVVAIHRKKVAYHACTDRFSWVRIGLLQPIPLTPEILEKNGLKIDKYKGGFFPACFKEDEYSDVEIEMKDEEIAWSINCGEYWIKRLNYVHELQHALRLFGINKEIEI